MIKYTTGYKVVKKRSLISCVIVGKNIARQYKINKWVKPTKGNGPLCVFNTIEDARNFAWDFHTIYECLYERSKERTVYVSNSSEGRSLFLLPTGTILATKVKLIRRIG